MQKGARIAVSLLLMQDVGCVKTCCSSKQKSRLSELLKKESVLQLFKKRNKALGRRNSWTIKTKPTPTCSPCRTSCSFYVILNLTQVSFIIILWHSRFNQDLIAHKNITCILLFFVPFFFFRYRKLFLRVQCTLLAFHLAINPSTYTRLFGQQYIWGRTKY